MSSRYSRQYIDRIRRGGVEAAAAVQEIFFAVGTVEEVVAVAAVKLVVSGAADERVIALQTKDDVVARAADEAVVEARAGELVVPVAAEQDRERSLRGRHRRRIGVGDDIAD